MVKVKYNIAVSSTWLKRVGIYAQTWYYVLDKLKYAIILSELLDNWCFEEVKVGFEFNMAFHPYLSTVGFR